MQLSFKGKDMKRTVTALSAIILAGCATWGQFDEGLDALLNMPLSTAIDRLGYPSGERTVAGRRLVEWGRSTNGAMYMPTTATTYGTVNTNRGFGSYSGTTTGGTFMPVNYNCNVTLEVDQDDIIRRYQYEGNLGGCERYIRALKR